MARLSVLVALTAVFMGCGHMPHPKYPLGERDYNADPSRTYQKVKLESLVTNPSIDLAVDFWAIFDRRHESIWSPLYTPFNEDDYVSFSVWSPDARIWELGGRQSSVATLFISKQHPHLDSVMNVERYALIQVIGQIRSTFDRRPWIDVEKIVTDRRGSVYTDESLRRLITGLDDTAKAPASAIKNLDLALRGRLHTPARSLAHSVLGELHEKRAAVSRDAWKDAMDHYDAAVLLDPSNQAARLGYDRASMQVDLLKKEKEMKPKDAPKPPEKKPEPPKK